MALLRNPIGLALAGLAAFAAYKYSKMTPEQKRDLGNNLKEKGKKVLDSLKLQSKSQANNLGVTENTNFAG